MTTSKTSTSSINGQLASKPPLPAPMRGDGLAARKRAKDRRRSGTRKDDGVGANEDEAEDEDEEGSCASGVPSDDSDCAGSEGEAAGRRMNEVSTPRSRSPSS